MVSEARMKDLYEKTSVPFKVQCWSYSVSMVTKEKEHRSDGRETEYQPQCQQIPYWPSLLVRGIVNTNKWFPGV